MKTQIIFVVCLSFPITSIAECKNIYTIGAYDEAFANHKQVIKLGPMQSRYVPHEMPKSFLEKDGSYAGGEAFCTIDDACRALKTQLKSGFLSTNQNWHVYKFDDDWKYNTYKLRDNNYRISHTLKISELAQKNC